jgi:hypothetical protein
MGDMKDPATPSREYLNKENDYVSQACFCLVDARIIGVMHRTDPQLTFCYDIKSSIFYIMRDNTQSSVFTKCVWEVNAKSDNPILTNGLAIQVVIKDGKDEKETEA